MLLLTVLAVVETILFFIGVNTSPAVMVLIPLGIIILWWLINNPAVALMILSLTAIIKGYLLNYFPVFEIVDITVVVTLIIWLGLIKMLMEGNWKLPSEQKTMVCLFLIFGVILGISYIYTHLLPTMGSGKFNGLIRLRSQCL